MRRLPSRWLLASVLALLSCEGRVDPEGDAGSPDAAVPACTPGAVGLDVLFARFFDATQPTGCTTSGCHGTGAGNLTFHTAQELWQQTVGVTASGDRTRQRVAPGDPLSSHLYLKLSPAALGRMPTGGPYLDDAALVELAGWICAGAPFPDAGGSMSDGGSADAGTPDGGSVDAGPGVSLTGFTPSAGLEGTQVTLTGAGFSATAGQNEVRFNGALAQVRAATDTSLDTVVPAGATSGPLSVTVSGRTATSASSFTVLTVNPAPTLTAATPSALPVGLAATLTLTGTGFVSGAEAKLDGTALPTTLVSGTSLTAQVSAALVATTGTRQLTLTTPSPGGGTTAALTLSVENPAPALSTLTPSAVPAGSTTLTVTGTGFVSSSTVRVDGAAVPTTLVSGTQLTASVSAATFAVVGTRQVTVSSPAPGGGTSAALTLSVVNPLPVATTLTPSAVPTLAGAVPVVVTGSGFVPGSTVNLDGVPLATTFTSSTSLSAALPSFSSAGTHTVTVTTPAPGGGTSAGLTLTVSASTTPFISSLSPSPAPANQAFTLTVTGTNFTCTGTGARVLFGGSPLAPTTCGTTQLVVSVPSTAAGSISVQVQNPNTSTSNTVSLSVAAPNPVPVLSTLSPASSLQGGGAFTLAVTGTGFGAGATLSFNGATRPTTVVSATQLTASIPSSDLAAAGSFPVVVTNPAPGGGASNALSFAVALPNGVPVLTALSPSSVAAGSGAFTLTVTGSNFVSGAQATLNGLARTTTFGSATSVTVAVEAGDVVSAGGVPVVVTNPAPGGGASSPLTLQVVAPNPVPVLTSASPSQLTLNGGATTVTVTGAGFVPGLTATFNGAARTATYVSATTFSVALTAGDLSVAGSYPLVATNPAPGGGASNALSLSVAAANPAPTLSALAPCGVVAGAGQTPVTLTGTGFVAGSVVKFGTTTVTSSLVNATTLTATVPASLLATAPTGNVLNVTVTNPAPGGGASAAATFGVASATSTLSGTVQPIFTANCTATCHSGAISSAGLDLSSAAVSLASLVNAPSTQCVGGMRVVACAPTRAKSVLLDKVLATATSLPCSGFKMPKSGSLAASELQAIIDWVAQGAPP